MLKRQSSASTQLEMLQQSILDYLDSLLNESAYRVEGNYGDIEIEGLQARRRWTLLELLRSQGCRIEQDGDGIWRLLTPTNDISCPSCGGTGRVVDWVYPGRRARIPCRACNRDAMKM